MLYLGMKACFNTHIDAANTNKTERNVKTQDIAVERAVRLLEAAKASFKIISANGTEFGSLEVKQEPKRRSTGINYVSLYKEKILSAQVGDVVEITPPSDVPVTGLRSAAGAFAAQRWGKGGCITSVQNGKLEILRIK